MSSAANENYELKSEASHLYDACKNYRMCHTQVSLRRVKILSTKQRSMNFV